VVTDTIKGLLILQDRDEKVASIDAEIARLPNEIQRLEAAIETEESTLESTIRELKELEVQRKDLELEVESAETQIGRYKNQQLEVKKNEEYRALTHEIEQTQEKISDLETRELEIMESIDRKNGELETLKGEVAKRVEAHRKSIKACEAKLTQMKAERDDAIQALERQKSEIGEELFHVFDRLKDRVKRPPYVTQVAGQNCGGCHMRVSNDVYKKTRIGELAYCDQCSRLLYFDS